MSKVAFRPRGEVRPGDRVKSIAMTDTDLPAHLTHTWGTVTKVNRTRALVKFDGYDRSRSVRLVDLRAAANDDTDEDRFYRLVTAALNTPPLPGVRTGRGRR